MVWDEILRLLEDPTIIQNELNRRLEAASESSPTKRRLETLNRELIRVRKSIERLLTVYQEELLPLDELRVRMPPLRQREQAMQAELQAINNQTAERAAYLRLAETLTAFLERMRLNAQTLDVEQRQRIMRLLVKEVIVGKDLITIKHSIQGFAAPSGGNPQASESPAQTDGAQTDESYLLCKGRDNPALRGSRFRWEELVLVVVSRLKPFLKCRFIHGDVCGHPVVADIVKTAFDIAFQNPFGRTFGSQYDEALLFTVRRGSFWPKPIGIPIRRGFRDGFQRQQVQSLHRPVFHRRNAERP